MGHINRILALLIISLSAFSQTKLDKLVANEINQYRSELSVTKVKFDRICFQAANHHTTYLTCKNKKIWPNLICGHNEDTLKNPQNRYAFYTKEKYQNLAEVIVCINQNFNQDDTLILKKVAKLVVDGWKNSPPHNKIIISKDFELLGVSCQTFTHSVGVKSFVHYTIISTGVFLKK